MNNFNLELHDCEDLFAIRLMLQSSCSSHFLNELAKESFFEEKEEDEQNRDSNRREYIANLLKAHVPQIVVGEILADVIKSFPDKILPHKIVPPNKDIDMIDMFADIVSGLSSLQRKNICDKIDIIKKRSEGSIDEFLSSIITLKEGILYTLNIEKKYSSTINARYHAFCIKYKELENLFVTKTEIEVKKISTINIIRTNIEDFINILETQYPGDVELLLFKITLNFMERNIAESAQISEDLFFYKANTLLKKLMEFLEKEKSSSEMMHLLKIAVRLTEIQANTNLLQKKNRLPADLIDFFSKIPALIKEIKKELTTKSQEETLKTNINNYLSTCDV
jgi:hypothetical protein